MPFHAASPDIPQQSIDGLDPFGACDAPVPARECNEPGL